VTAADPVLAVAVRAAQRAASVLIDAARDLSHLPVFAKEHGDIAVGAEADAEDAIVATIRAAFPEHAILGEASGHIEGARSGDAHRWMVDPIDGAANFRHGYPYYAISIALALGNDITHAVVLDPVHDQCFTASRGHGAHCNGAQLRASACTALLDALVGTAPPPPENSAAEAHRSVFGALLTRCGGLRHAGSRALDCAHVAAGRLDAVFAMGASGWDMAAGALLVQEAGGRVGDFAGGHDYLRASDVIAAAPGLFNPLREAIDLARR
jgi:myo-inositol-1(or 4)-monophosphatase